MDLISRQAAIDALDALCDRECEYSKQQRSFMCGACRLGSAFDVIDELPSAQPEQRWIPCSERLPEKSGRYLVTRKFNTFSSLWARVYILNYSDLMGLKKEKIWWSGNVGKSDFETYDDVLAWMPLPKPYNAETK